MNFDKTYSKYLTRYLITEATEEETILTRFMGSVRVIASYIDEKAQSITFPPLNNINVYEYKNPNFKGKSTVKQHCYCTCELSIHGLYGYILRKNMELIREVYNYENNSELYKTHMSLSDFDINTPVNKKTKPKQFSDYVVDPEILTKIKANIDTNISTLADVLPQVYKLILTNKNYGIHLNMDMEYKALLTTTDVFVGINTHILSPDKYLIVIGNVYPANGAKTNNAKYYYPYTINL